MRLHFVAEAGKVLFSLAFVAAFATLVAAQSVTSTPAATPAPIAVAPGDAAVSGFSGVGLADATLPPGVNPLDKTVITLASPSLKILDLSSIGGEAATQLLPPNVKFAVPAKDIGQVFGLAFDAGSGAGAPNIYAAATSLYGLTIVAEKPGPDGTPVRLKAGAPGARFMEGQFGPGATPGAIWKIDGTTGKPSLFAETVDGSAGNSGPAVGDIAIDAKSNSLFASDLDTGLIHRFPLDGGGANRSTFDHGTTGRAAAQLPAVADDKKRADIASASFNPGDPKTWGFTQPERRIDGLAVRDGRLYYAVASGPEIWSVGIAADGSFAGDARREVEIRAEKPSVISDIVFDADGRMTAALRGALKGAPDYRQFVEPEAGAVLRYSPKTGDAKSPWVTPPETYTVGATSNTASGGVALGYAYNADGTYDFGKCSATLGATGDALPVVGGTSVNGAQVMRGDLVQPAKAPEKSVFVDFDALQNDKALTGHVGDIEIFQPCDGSQFPAMAGDPGAAPDSGAGAAPGGFGGPGGGGGGGGLPGEALPAEGTPEEGLAEAPVDPNASNLAETEAQQCPPPGSGKVPTIDDAAADGLSVKNVGERACTPNPDGKTTKCRFTVAFENKTDTAQEQFIKFRTEPAPQGPMGSETPGNSSGVRGDGAFFGFGSGPSDKVEPGQTGPPVVFVGDYLNGQEPVGQPSVDRVPRIRRNETAKCQPPQNGEQVCSVPLTFENPSQLDNPKIEITSNAEPKGVTISKGDQILSPTGSRNQGATITTFDTPFPANSTEELVATVVLPEGADTTFVARISDESTAAAEKLAQERADAAAAASQQAGGATTPGQTSDPGANQSCIAQGTPKNEPTLGAPIGQEAGNEPGATPSGETGPSSAEPSNTGPTACSPGQGINVFSFMPFSAECFTNADGNKECKWTTVLQNAPNQPELQAKFSELPLKVTSETENDFRVTEDPNGGERSFILTGPAAGGKQQITSLIAVFPPSNRPEPTAEISISPSTLAAAACPGDASPPPAGGQPAPCAEAPKPIQIFSFMPSEGCGLNQNGNKLCRWTASAQHVPFFAGDLEARFSVDPIEVNTEFPTDYHIKKGASGTPTDFSLEPHGVPDEQQTIFIVGEFPGNKPDPTIEISPAQSTIDAHNAQIAKACPMASKQEPDAAPPGQAVPAPDTPPASEQPDLVVTKLTPGKKDENGLVTCDVTTTCRFQIAVINNGGTYAGPLTIEDKIEPPPMPPGA
ncbi:MAG TPA: hypothetical protein VEA77_00390, partial [Hyphomicrobium sp.]|nr:hypothetical protein [Hyphomicrobium sp.]